MSRVIHFEIHAADPERAAAFYQAVFQWKIAEWKIPGVEMPSENRYWIVNTGEAPEPGINGGILIRRGPPPTSGQAVNAYVCTIGVASLDEAMARAEAAGGTLALPRMAIPGVGWLAYWKDPEGNLFGMMQEDPRAR